MATTDHVGRRETHAAGRRRRGEDLRRTGFTNTCGQRSPPPTRPKWPRSGPTPSRRPGPARARRPAPCQWSPDWRLRSWCCWSTRRWRPGWPRTACRAEVRRSDGLLTLLTCPITTLLGSWRDRRQCVCGLGRARPGVPRPSDLHTSARPLLRRPGDAAGLGCTCRAHGRRSLTSNAPPYWLGASRHERTSWWRCRTRSLRIFRRTRRPNWPTTTSA
jgi:hypothetical protein